MKSFSRPERRTGEGNINAMRRLPIGLRTGMFVVYLPINMEKIVQERLDVFPISLPPFRNSPAAYLEVMA